MSAIDTTGVLRSLQARVPWSVATKLMHLYGVKPAKGWSNTIEKLASGEVAVNPEDAQALVDALVEHIECGEKLMRFYKLDAADKRKLASILRNNVVDDDPKKAVYPLSLNHDAMEEAELGPGVLIDVRENDDEVVGVYSSVLAVEFRVPVNWEDLPVAARDSLSTYSELYGIQARRLQTMDVIRVPKADDGIVEVRCDYPAGLSAEGVGTSLNVMHRRVQQIVGAGVKPINLFPIIDKMFKKHDEGDIVEAAFTTQSGSVKHEKMRRNSTSLREEPYHQAGRAAIADALDVYKLALRWVYPHSDEISSAPEAFFSGTARMVGLQSPWLSDVWVTQCIGEPDYNFVRDKILSYLT